MPAAHLLGPAVPRSMIDYQTGCTGKVPQSHAQAVAVVLRWPGRTIYRCRFCSAFHVSHITEPDSHWLRNRR